MNKPNMVVEVEKVAKGYELPGSRLEILTEINWRIRAGEWAALLGASGSGKTTLLNLIGALEKPDRGTIRVGGVDCSGLNRRAAAEFRNRRIGFVFQTYCLLPELSVLENVMLPGLMAKTASGVVAARARVLLDRVGLGARLKHRPTELSGGEQQRAAIARALINDPELLLADEPTGNLDGHTGQEILNLFRELRAANPERAIVMITHNPAIAALADMVATLADGTLTVASPPPRG